MPAVRRDGLDIHYEVTGDGPPVLLLHSFLCSTEMWRAVVPALAARHRVVNVDARGHGRSGRPTAPFTFRDALADHLAVLDALGIARAAWVGLSQGAMIALLAALEAPARVAALALLDADGGAETRATRLQHAVLGAVARVAGLRTVLPVIERLMFATWTRRREPALVAEWSLRFAQVHVPSMLLGLDAVDEREDLLPRLPSVSVPALVLVGAEDAALPPERSRRLAAALPGARFAEIPRAGHLSALEQPEVVAAELLGFLGGAERRASPAAPADEADAGRV